jgi:ABC-2 type transport system ATP-binding protein
MENTEAIRAVSVSKSFGDIRAIRDLSIQVRFGEIRGLLGPNGSGKSTFMKIILGILRLDAGSVTICGIDVKTSPIEARRMIGYVPETPRLYEYLTAAEYLDFIGSAYVMQPDVRTERVRELLHALQMEEHVNELMSGYSQGMRQKIALIAALLHKPRVLILDEPLNGLDPRSARIVKDLLNRLASEGVAVLFSTHVLEIAEAICHRVTIVNEGSVLATGTIQELRSMVGLNGSSLEDVFLRLTGGEDTAEVVEALRL